MNWNGIPKDITLNDLKYPEKSFKGSSKHLQELLKPDRTYCNVKEFQKSKNSNGYSPAFFSYLPDIYGHKNITRRSGG